MKRSKKLPIPKEVNYSHRCRFCGEAFSVRHGYVLAIYKEFSPFLFDDDKTTEKDTKERQMYEYVCPDCAKKLKDHLNTIDECEL